MQATAPPFIFHALPDVVEEQNEEDEEIELYDEETELYLACIRCDIQKVTELLDQGANIHEPNSAWSFRSRELPLHAAVNAGYMSLVKLLIERGANVNADSFSYRGTPLHIAIYNGNLEMVRYLLQVGADYTCRILNKETCLEYAENLAQYVEYQHFKEEGEESVWIDQVEEEEENYEGGAKDRKGIVNILRSYATCIDVKDPGYD